MAVLKLAVQVLVVGLMAVPYWWRFQQCLRKYRDGRKVRLELLAFWLFENLLQSWLSSRLTFAAIATQAFPDLVNALKYFTAFPLIFVDKCAAHLPHQRVSM